MFSGRDFSVFSPPDTSWHRHRGSWCSDPKQRILPQLDAGNRGAAVLVILKPLTRWLGASIHFNAILVIWRYPHFRKTIWFHMIFSWPSVTRSLVANLSCPWVSVVVVRVTRKCTGILNCKHVILYIDIHSMSVYIYIYIYLGTRSFLSISDDASQQLIFWRLNVETRQQKYGCVLRTRCCTTNLVVYQCFPLGHFQHEVSPMFKQTHLGCFQVFLWFSLARPEQRDRDRKRVSERERERDVCVCVCIHTVYTHILCISKNWGPTSDL